MQVEGNSFANIKGGGVTISDVSSLSLTANVWANQPLAPAAVVRGGDGVPIVWGLDLARISRVAMMGNILASSSGGALARRLRGIGQLANTSNIWGGG